MVSWYPRRSVISVTFLYGSFGEARWWHCWLCLHPLDKRSTLLVDGHVSKAHNVTIFLQIDMMVLSMLATAGSYTKNARPDA